MALRAFLAFFVLALGTAVAAPLRFEASTLKFLYHVSLEEKKGAVIGVLERSEYGVNRAKYRFTGQWTPLPSGDKGRGLLVTFLPKDLKKYGDPTPFPPPARTSSGGSFPPRTATASTSAPPAACTPPRQSGKSPSSSSSLRIREYGC